MSKSQADSRRVSSTPGGEPLPARLADGKPHDIRERTLKFAVDTIQFVRTMPRTLDGVEVGRQLIRAGTSVGANMEEADAAESRRDFIHKVSISRKEAREARYWYRVCIAADIGAHEQARALLQESDELVRILSRIIRNTEARAG